MPASASAMSIRVFSLLSTRSDSSPQAGQRRAQVVRDVVQRFAHSAQERLVLIEQGVKELYQVVEFVVRAAFRDAGVHFAGADDGAGGGNELADGLHGAMGKKCASQKAQDHCNSR